MTIKEFNEIIKTPSKYMLDKWAIEVWRGRLYDKKYHKWVINDLNYDGNSVFTNKAGDSNLRELYTSKVFTIEEWNILLSHIFYKDFNNDFNKLAKKVIPLFNRISDYWEDLHLEFWQGIFSFGTHWYTRGKSPKESINSPYNGELYCNTLLEIYPIFKEFIDKWGNQYTLFRFCKAIGPNQYKGLLYEQ